MVLFYNSLIFNFFLTLKTTGLISLSTIEVYEPVYLSVLYDE